MKTNTVILISYIIYACFVFACFAFAGTWDYEEYIKQNLTQQELSDIYGASK